MQVSRTILFSAALLAAASAAPAAEHGFYAGASYSSINADTPDRPILALGPPNPAGVQPLALLALYGNPGIGDSGYKLMTGYRAMDWLAFEADYSDLGEARSPVDLVCVIGPCPNALVGDSSSASVSALGLVPIGKLDLFVRAGLSRWRTNTALRADGQTVSSTSESDTEPTYGAGVQYQVRRVLARLEYQRMDLGVDRADVTSLGFAWTF